MNNVFAIFVRLFDKVTEIENRCEKSTERINYIHHGYNSCENDMNVNEGINSIHKSVKSGKR